MNRKNCAPTLNPKIIIDERERGEIRSVFENLDCEISIDTLDFGDYIVSSRCAIERKRGDDLISSIFDTRFFQQLSKLKEVFQFPILILESPEKAFSRKYVKESSIYGALVYAAYKMNIPIIPTKNALETAKTVVEIAQNEQQKGYFPENLPFIDRESISHEINLDDQKFLLEGLIDVGDKKATRFLDVLGNPTFILHAISEATINYTKNGKPKNISGIIEGFKGIGTKFIIRNQKLLNFSYSKSRKMKLKIRDLL
ncbi:MAG: ERCC4 domain-containing protein [Promethearchaeota archaeon]